MLLILKFMRLIQNWLIIHCIVHYIIGIFWLIILSYIIDKIDL